MISSSIGKILPWFLGSLYETDAFTSYLDQFSHVYMSDPPAELEEFMAADPTMYEFQAKFEELHKFEHKVDKQQDHYVVGALYVGLDDFKRKIKNTISILKRVRRRKF